jgi:putative transferase (TIGR04331 family)
LRIADILKINKKIIYNNLETDNCNIPNTKHNKNFLSFFFYYCYNLYIKFFKPIILIDSYFCFIDKLKIIYLSKGKILFPTASYFFRNTLNIEVDKKFRDKIKIKEKDLFDKTFNSLLGYLIPTSFLENFNIIKKSVLNYSKNISLLGSAVCFFSNDHYKILTAEMLRYKKKPLIFAHGHSDNLITYDSKFKFELKNIYKHIAWNDKNGLGISNLRRLNNHSRSKKYKKSIILFTTKVDKFFFKTLFPIRINNHKETLINNMNFYNSLKKNIKPNFLLKPHLNSWSQEKEIWSKKFGKNLNVYLSADSTDVINQSKIIVVGYISVSAFESLYLDKPTIIFCNIEDYFFKKEHLLFFKKMIKAKILHKNANQAADFINKNYFNIERWWQSGEVRNIIHVIKNKYCIDNNKFADSLINCLIYKKI